MERATSVTTCAMTTCAMTTRALTTLFASLLAVCGGGLVAQGVPEPVVRLELLFPVEGRARLARNGGGGFDLPDKPIVARVFVGHAGAEGTAPRLRLGADDRDLGKFLRLEWLGPDGEPLGESDWSSSASSLYGALELAAGQRRSFLFSEVTTTRFKSTFRPGAHALRAVLEVKDGPNWRGRVESPAVVVELLPPAQPQLAVAVPSGGALCPGDPLLVALTFVAGADSAALDDDMVPAAPMSAPNCFDLGRMPDGLVIEVQDAGGRAVALPTRPQLLFADDAPDRRSLRRPGDRYGPVVVRFAATALAGLAPGDYRLAVRYGVSPKLPPVAPEPVPIRLLAPGSESDPDVAMASVALAFAEARALLDRAQVARSFLSWQETLVAAAAAAIQRVAPRLDGLPASPRKALLQAELQWLRGDGPAARAALAAVSPSPDDRRLAQAMDLLQRRFAARPEVTVDYFTDHWQKALRQVGAQGDAVASGARPAGAAAAASAAPTGASVVKPRQPVYLVGETVEATYAGLPVDKRNWITLVPAADPETSYKEYSYVEAEGTVRFTNRLEPGFYEIRVFHDYPTGGYTVRARAAIEIKARP